MASGLSEKDKSTQIAALVYSMASIAEDILAPFTLMEDEYKAYHSVKHKFDSHFMKRRNVIFERTKFNYRRQGDDESVESFVTALSEHCEFGALREELIRDRMVVGLHDAKLSETLQKDVDLTLDKAITRARQSESLKMQQTVGRHLSMELPITLDTTGVETILTRWNASSKHSKRNLFQKFLKATTHEGGKGKFFISATKQTGDNCSRCGQKPSHGRAVCAW